MSSQANKKVVFFPIDGLNQVEETLLEMNDNNGCILVLEDAENLLVTRTNRSALDNISMLLNITSGAVGELLETQIVCTFNSSLDDIDEALLRPGRLRFIHEFKKLEVEDSQILIDKLGKKHVATEPMSLAEIYALDSDIGSLTKEKKRKVGFA